MTYRVEVAAAAARQLRKLDRSAQRRVQAAIELLADEPRPSGAKKLVGGNGEWRVRTGDYRIVYEIAGASSRFRSRRSGTAPGLWRPIPRRRGC